MNVQRQTNTFTKGMNMDLDYSVIDSSQYVYAENIRIVPNDSGSSAVMQNIEGVLKTRPSKTFSNEEIIHTSTIRDWSIVFTKVKNSDNFNIYRIDFGISEVEPKVTTIIQNMALDINYEDGKYTISSVCRWESDDNVKIYWCDGKNSIRVLNVDDAHIGSITNPESLNITPNAVLPPLKYKSTGSGSLKAGKYQLCYQLFNARGSETSVSVLSEMIHVSSKDSNKNSQDIIGDTLEANTGKSITVSVTLPNTDFTRAKIIALYYKDNTSVPEITIADDISFTGTTMSYTLYSNSAVSELSVDDFSSLTSYQFSPKVLESKDNMLFAANIKETTWDISDDEFDARAYRCNKSGNILLQSATSQDTKSFSIDDINNKNIPKDHDCICPYNLDSSSEYRYTKTTQGNYVYGGKGKNIEYQFIMTDLIEDSEVLPASGKVKEDFKLNSKSVTVSSLQTYTLDHNGDKTIAGSIPLSSSTSRVLNYADPEIDAKVRGYQREEIYRFAIVFYNKQNLPSSAHWIADIKMPSYREEHGYGIFTKGKRVELGSGNTDNCTVVTHPLGIQFTVKSENIPAGVTAYEIVRCERTILDRSILMQGIVSLVTAYGSEANSLYPMPYLSYCKNHGYYAKTQALIGAGDYEATFNLSEYKSNDYFIFISPELCVNRENSSELLDKATSIKGLYKLKSEIEPDTSIAEVDSTKVLANAKSVKGDGINIGQYTATDLNKYNGFVNNSGTTNNIILNGNLFYTASLAKYYTTYSVGSFNDATVEDITLANDTDPFDFYELSWKTKGTGVGNKTYYNWVYDHEETDVDEDYNNVRKQGPHGVCAVFYSKDMLDRNTMVGETPEKAPDASFANTVLLANLKQDIIPYGGNTYAVRQNSTYISTGCYQTITEESEYVNPCFGGDTYIGVMDYTNVSMCFRADDYSISNESGSANRMFNGAYFPCETSVNLSLRSDDIQVSKTYESGTGYANHFVQNNVIQIGNYYTQNEPLYGYNDAYSAEPNLKQFTSKSIYNIDDLTIDTRVLNSLPKTNNEVSDSWSKFKVANYIDVDSRYGSINVMKTFNNTLFFWQTDAFGVLAVNERSLITDNNPGALTLGTSGVLTRYDYITNYNGIKENQLRAATSSDGGIYWYDADRSEICSYSGKLNAVSKLKGVQSYLNDGKNKLTFTNDPVTVFDKKYNEILFTLDDKTLVYNEQVGAFTSFYKIKPEWYSEFSDKLYMYNGLNIYKLNAGNDLDLVSEEDKVSYVKFIVNQNYTQTKTFDNVEYGGDFSEDTNFNEIYFETKRQTSYTTTDSDIDYREDTYKFCIPRNNIELNEAEQLVNKSYRDRMKGKYLVCHYKYDCNGGNTFKVPYISTAYRNSMI